MLCCGITMLSFFRVRVDLLVLVFILLRSVLTTKTDVYIGVILPENESYPWSLKLTRPAIEYAVEAVTRNPTLLPNHKLILNIQDSNCSDTTGPLAAIDMVVNKAAHVFLGPACAYAVAPVARFSYSWGIPVISAGGLVAAFKSKDQYKLLTRIQGSYEKAGLFFVDVVRHFNWSRVGLLYHDIKTQANSERSKCYFQIESIFIELHQELGVRPWNRKYDQTENVDYGELLHEVSQKVRSKEHVLLFFKTYTFFYSN